MKNLSLTFFILFCCFFAAVFSHSITKRSSLSKSSLLDKISYNTNFGKNLLSVLQIKLKTNGKLDEVYSLLNELEDNLKNQQSDASSENRVKNTNWDTQIQAYADEIRRLVSALETDNTSLLNNEQEKRDHESAKAALQLHLDATKESLRQYNEMWELTVERYNARNAERNRVIEALDQIILILNNKVNENSFVELKNLVSNLKSVHKLKNPIMTLVELTMSFNPEQVRSIIEKLVQIRDSIHAGNENDKQLYEKLKPIVAQTRADLEKAIRSDEEGIEAQEDAIANNKRNIDNLTTAIASNESLKKNNEDSKKATEDEQVNANKKFADDSAIRASEIEVIKEVRGILQASESNLRKNE